MKENQELVNEIEMQMHSFAEALSTVIDERSPYNGNHTRRVAGYTELLVDYLNKQYEAGRYERFFDRDVKEPLILAAFLHDIGKTITPLSVMNKPTRLSNRMEKIRERFRYLRACMEIDYLKGHMTKEEYRAKTDEVLNLYHAVQRMNKTDQTDPKDVEYVNRVGEYTYKLPTGRKIHYLTKYEIECLNIYSGTLTDAERLLMEKHVAYTEKILSKVRFSKKFANVPKWASQHHEYLDGSGYPNHLMAKDLDVEARILTVADLYDAFTSSDRPYKDGWSRQEAFDMLYSMVDEGKLDRELVDFLGEALDDAGIDVIEQENVNTEN